MPRIFLRHVSRNNRIMAVRRRSQIASAEIECRVPELKGGRPHNHRRAAVSERELARRYSNSSNRHRAIELRQPVERRQCMPPKY